MSDTLSVPSIRTSVKVLYPLFSFLEDIWFYKYHENEYSDTVETIFEEIERVNEEKITPDFLKI